MWISTLKSQMIVLTEGEIYHNNVLIVLIPYHFRIQIRHPYTSRFLVYSFYITHGQILRFQILCQSAALKLYEKYKILLL